MATEQKYFSLRGDGALRKRAAGAQYRKVGNVREAVITLTQETIDLKSTGNTAGTIAEDVISREATIKLTLDSQSLENTALGLAGTVVDIPAVTDGTFDLPALKAGQLFKLPSAAIETLNIAGKTAGVDYKLTAYAGVVEALKDIAAVAGCTYTSKAYQAIGLFTGADDEYQFMLWSDKSKRTYEVLRVKLNPGEHQLISDQYGQIALEGKLLVDPDVDTSSLPAAIKSLGGFVRVSDASAAV